MISCGFYCWLTPKLHSYTSIYTIFGHSGIHVCSVYQHQLNSGKVMIATRQPVPVVPY